MKLWKRRPRLPLISPCPECDYAQKKASRAPTDCCPRVLTKVVENAVQIEPVGEFELKAIGPPLATYDVVGAAS
jgi:hypothetical protein